MTLKARFLEWLRRPVPHRCRDYELVPELCEPYQPVYRCRTCGDLYLPCNR